MRRESYALLQRICYICTEIVENEGSKGFLAGKTVWKIKITKEKMLVMHTYIHTNIYGNILSLSTIVVALHL